MFDELISATTSIRGDRETSVQIGPFSGGMVTSKPPNQLSKDECADLVNMVIESDGRVKTRDGFAYVKDVYSIYFSLPIKSIAHATIAGTSLIIFAATYKPAATTFYRLYKYPIAGGSVAQIGTDATFRGPITVVPFNNVLMIFDGSYVKYWDGTTVALALDYGIGNENYFINNVYDGDIAEKPPQNTLSFSASTSRIAYKFNTGDTDGMTVAPTTFTVYMAKYGNGYSSGYDPTTPIKLVIRTTASVIMASKDMMVPDELPEVTALTPVDENDYQAFTYTFTAADITTNLSGSTNYYFSIEYAGADASNYPIVLLNTGSTTSTTYIYTTVWSVYGGTTNLLAPQVRFKSTLPPKALYGFVNSERVFCFQGSAGDYPNRLYYCGAGDHLDWSSPDYGGYLDAGGGIGAVRPFYDNIWVFGTRTEPFLKRLSGATPASYVLSDSLQYISADQPSTVTTDNDIIFLNQFGVSSIKSVETYGDVKVYNQSENISNKFTSTTVTGAFAGYDAKNGIYLLYLTDGTNYVYALHTASKKVKYAGGIPYQIYPVSRWVLNLPSQAGSITCISGCGDRFYVGTSAGYIYRLNYGGALADPEGKPAYLVKSADIPIPFGQFCAKTVNMDLGSSADAYLNINLYRNRRSTAHVTKTVYITDDFSEDPPESEVTTLFRGLNRFQTNFNFRWIAVQYDTIVPGTSAPVYIGSVNIRATNMGGF